MDGFKNKHRDQMIKIKNTTYLASTWDDQLDTTINSGDRQKAGKPGKRGMRGTLYFHLYS